MYFFVHSSSKCIKKDLTNHCAHLLVAMHKQLLREHCCIVVRASGACVVLRADFAYMV